MDLHTFRYACNQNCGVFFETNADRAQHDLTCPLRLLSCCQNISSCRHTINNWTATNNGTLELRLCRHKSNGFFGAIRENNIDLVRFFLLVLRSNLADVYLQETSFGDNLLTYAATSGRAEIMELLLSAIHGIVEQNRERIAMTDFTNRETARGKTPIIEAVKSNHVDVVTTLLRYGADPNLCANMHKKSAMDWARVMNHEVVLEIMQERIDLENSVTRLFVAISNRDMPAIKALISGGVPYEFGQERTFSLELKVAKIKADQLAQDIKDLTEALASEMAAKDELFDEIKKREKRIENLKTRQNEIISNRRREISTALANVRQNATEENILDTCNTESPPLEFEFLSSALCSLFHIRLKKHQEAPSKKSSSFTTENGARNMPHWLELKRLLRDKNSFLHRLKHYHFDPIQVTLVSNVEVHGTSFSKWLEGTENGVRMNMYGNDFMASIASWLAIIFRCASGQTLETQMMLEESTDRELLEKHKIQFSVLTSRCAILRREIDYVKKSLESVLIIISKIERKLQVCKIMRFVTTDGHTALSWAAASGYDAVVMDLLKNGACTGVGDAVVHFCASIIQTTFRFHSERKKYHNISGPTEERTLNLKQHDLSASIRLKSLSKLLRNRLKSVRLPMIEALYNGHVQVAKLLNDSDFSLLQAINFYSTFHSPNGMLPRKASPPASTAHDFHDIISCIIAAGKQFQFDVIEKCSFLASCKLTMQLVDSQLKKRRHGLEKKISSRRETLFMHHKRKMAKELRSAIFKSDYARMVEAAESGKISLDYEDSLGMTPLIRAASEDIHAPGHAWCKNQNGQQVNAVAFILDRVSLYRPNIDYENKHGHTALSMACSLGRMDAVAALLERGADVNKRSFLNGKTPLMHACIAGKLDVVKRLLLAGAELSPKDTEERTAHDLARIERHDAIVDLLDVA